MSRDVFIVRFIRADGSVSVMTSYLKDGDLERLRDEVFVDGDVVDMGPVEMRLMSQDMDGRFNGSDSRTKGKPGKGGRPGKKGGK